MFLKVEDGFMIHVTSNCKETARFLAAIGARLQKRYHGKTLASSSVGLKMNDEVSVSMTMNWLLSLNDDHRVYNLDIVHRLIAAIDADVNDERVAAIIEKIASTNNMRTMATTNARLSGYVR